jgi:hypothetical protein
MKICLLWKPNIYNFCLFKCLLQGGERKRNLLEVVHTYFSSYLAPNSSFNFVFEFKNLHKSI